MVVYFVSAHYKQEARAELPHVINTHVNITFHRDRHFSQSSLLNVLSSPHTHLYIQLSHSLMASFPVTLVLMS